LTVRTETLVESLPRDLELTVSEAKALVALGRSLGLAVVPPLDEQREESAETSLIRCTMNPDGRWCVVVSDAVGLVSIGDLRILVEPKIPSTHLFYLFSRAEILPRLAPAATVGAEGDIFGNSSAAGFSMRSRTCFAAISFVTTSLSATRLRRRAEKLKP
jgi:hypothetical protein